MIQNLEYENLVDFLVVNSFNKFETPEGILTGRQLLSRLWLKYAPADGPELLLTAPEIAQVNLCSKRRVILENGGDVWDVKVANDTGDHYIDIGLRLA